MSTDMEKLKQLKQLKDQGLLDDDEYMERRSEIIDRMTGGANAGRPSQAQPAPVAADPKKSLRKAPAPPAEPAAAPAPSRATTKPTVLSPRATVSPAAKAAALRESEKPKAKQASGPVVKERAPDECWECGERLYGKVVTTNNHNYHLECFCCSVCSTPLAGKTFFPKGEEVACAAHAAMDGHGPCPKCQQAIEGDFVEADGHKFHEGCFVCAYGGCALDGGWARGADGEPYCFLHINMMSSSMCVECNKMITSDLVTFNGEKRHGRCFVCAFCQNPLGKGKFYNFDGQAFCFTCHKNLHYAQKQ